MNIIIFIVIPLLGESQIKRESRHNIGLLLNHKEICLYRVFTTIH